MPLKLNIGMSRKVGERNYGSRGATVGLEMEVDSSLVNQPRELHKQIVRLFRLAKASVDQELAVRNDDANQPAAEAPAHRGATANQVRAIHAITKRQELDPYQEVKTRFGVCRPEDLSLEQASQLIDAIKPSTNGAMSHP